MTTPPDYDPDAPPPDDDGLGFYNLATLDTYVTLRAALTILTPVTTASVVCNQAPLQIRGDLADGRIWFFHARHGSAGLAVAIPDQAEQPTEHTTSCPDDIAVEHVDTIVTLMHELLARHGL